MRAAARDRLLLQISWDNDDAAGDGRSPSRRRKDIMKNVIIIGANGRSARQIITRLTGEADVTLTLFARRPDRVADIAGERSVLVDGDAHDKEALARAMV